MDWGLFIENEEFFLFPIYPQKDSSGHANHFDYPPDNSNHFHCKIGLFGYVSGAY